MKTLSKLNSALCLTAASVLLLGCNPGGGGSGENNTQVVDEFSFEKANLPINEVMASKCLSVDAALVGLADTHIKLSGNAQVAGNAYIDVGAQLTMNGNAVIEGTLYKYHDGPVALSQKARVVGGTTATNVSVTEHLYMWSAKVASYQATQTFSKINASKIIEGNGSVNVIAVSGDVDLHGKETLVFNGSASDRFIINVYGKVNVSGQAQILVSGGLKPENVIFNLVTTSGVKLAGSGTIYGSILAVRSGIQITGQGRIYGLVAAKTEIVISGNGMTLGEAAYCPEVPVATPTPAPTPEPTATPQPTPAPTPAPTATPNGNGNGGGNHATPTPAPTASPTPAPTPDIPPPEEGGPGISEIAIIEVSFDFIQVAWKTDVASTSQAIFRNEVTGETTVTPVDSSLVTSHMLFVNNLQADTPYSIQLISVSAEGKTTTSSPITTRTIP